MKNFRRFELMASALVLATALIGCSHKPYNSVTDLDSGKGRTGGTSTTTSAPSSPPLSDSGGIKSEDLTHPIPSPDARKDWPRNAEIFKADTVYFDLDSAVVKSSEKSKLSAVADYLKSNPLDAVEVDGHADERGTEEYNRALGERRALALREELIKLGVDGARIDTLSYGKDRPADPGHTEAAHRKNRRVEFLLEQHPK